MHIQNKLKQSSVKIIFNPFINYLDNDTLLVSDYRIKLKKGKNRIVLPRNIRSGFYTIYLNGKKEIEFFE